jgi:polysaccharide export outer membrane protein
MRFLCCLTLLTVGVPVLLCAADSSAGKQAGPKNYVLGPDDQITVRVLDVEEVPDKPVQLDRQGNIKLPLIGRMQASGLSVEQLEDAVRERLKRYVNDPQVVIHIAEYRSQPVSVLGSVNSPGIQQVQGRKTLFEVLSMAGGLRPDAGYNIKITRQIDWGDIPLPTARLDPSGEFSIAEVQVKDVMEAKNPGENILICPNDVISVPRAQIVYVIGNVRKPGGFVLGENATMSALDAVSMAEGFDRFAAAAKAKILRPIPGEPARTEIPVDLKKLLAGKIPDILLQPGDILYVPNSTAKSITARGLDSGIQIGTGLAIWR